MANFYDFETINREIPIEDVLAFHGIRPSSKMRDSGWYSIREDDDTPSAHIDANRRFGNTIHDFGYGNTFNPLTLTMYLQGVDMVEASRILGEAFNIAPKISGREGEDSAGKVSDYEWKMLGIYPDMVSKNIDFDLDKYGLSSSMKLSERYKISMEELREQVTGPNAEKADERDKRRYESILRSRAVPFVYEKRYEYFRRMHDDYQLAKAVSRDMEVDKIFRIHQDDYETLAKKLSQIETSMKKVLEGTSVKFKGRRYNPIEDFHSVINGEVSFEIGLNSHYEVSRAAFLDKTKVFYCTVDMNEYYALLNNGLSNMQVAARQKGEQVTLSFLSSDSGKVNYLIKALRGKEAYLAETLGEALVGAQAEKKDVVIRSEPMAKRPSNAIREADERAGDDSLQRSDSVGIEHKRDFGN